MTNEQIAELSVKLAKKGLDESAMMEEFGMGEQDLAATKHVPTPL